MKEMLQVKDPQVTTVQYGRLIILRMVQVRVGWVLEKGKQSELINVCIQSILL